MGKLVDSNGLCKELSIKKRTLQSVWREYPHIFVAKGRDLRSARFDVDEVIDYLKKRDCKDERMVQKESKKLDVQIPPQQKDVRSDRVQNQECSSKSRARKTPGVGKYGQLHDPYGLLS